MSTTIVVKCDKCGHSGQPKKEPMFRLRISDSNENGAAPLRYADLCPACADSIAEAAGCAPERFHAKRKRKPQ